MIARAVPATSVAVDALLGEPEEEEGKRDRDQVDDEGRLGDHGHPGPERPGS